MQSKSATLKWPLAVALGAAAVGLLAYASSNVSRAEASIASVANSVTDVIAISCGGVTASPYVADTAIIAS